MAPFRFAAAILRGQSIDIYNYGRMWRDFTYIDDVAEGVLRVATREPSGHRLFNVGNSLPVGLMDFIGTLEAALGRRARKRFLPVQPGDVIATHADVEDFWRAVGFRPSTPLALGIERFARWYLEYFGEVTHEHGNTRADFNHTGRARVFHAS
jgi:UDP-glucuronate 4-epimerase